MDIWSLYIFPPLKSPNVIYVDSVISTCHSPNLHLQCKYIWISLFVDTNTNSIDSRSYYGCRGATEAERADQDSQAAGGSSLCVLTNPSLSSFLISLSSHTIVPVCTMGSAEWLFCCALKLVLQLLSLLLALNTLCSPAFLNWNGVIGR